MSSRFINFKKILNKYLLDIKLKFHESNGHTIETSRIH